MASAPRRGTRDGVPYASYYANVENFGGSLLRTGVGFELDGQPEGTTRALAIVPSGKDWAVVEVACEVIDSSPDLVAKVSFRWLLRRRMVTVRPGELVWWPRDPNL